MAITEAYETRVVSTIAGSNVHYRFCWSLIRPTNTSRFTQAKSLGEAVAFGTAWFDALRAAHTFHQEFLYVKTRCLLPFSLGPSYRFRLPLRTLGGILDLAGTVWESATIQWITTSPLNTVGTWGLRAVVNAGFVGGKPSAFLRGVVDSFTTIHLSGLTLSTGNIALPAVVHKGGSWTIIEDYQWSPQPGRKTAHQQVT